MSRNNTIQDPSARNAISQYFANAFEATKKRLFKTLGATALGLSAFYSSAAYAAQPNAADDGFFVEQPAPTVTVDVLANDAADTAMTLSAVSQPPAGRGTTAIVNNQVEYTPAGFIGDIVFTYEMRDANNLTSQATVRGTVGPANTAPTALDDVVVALQGQSPLVARATDNDSDADGDNFIITGVSPLFNPASGSVTFNDDHVIFTPAGGFVGTEAVTYQIDDFRTNGSAFATITFQVNPNDTLQAADDAVSTPQNTPVTVNIVGNDTTSSGNPITIVSVAGEINGTFTNTATDITFTPDPLVLKGQGSVIAEVTDGINTRQETLVVDIVPNPAVANPDSINTLEDMVVSFDPTLNDVAPNGNLNITSNTQPANGTLVQNGNAFDYTPGQDFNGIVTFDYTADDGLSPPVTTTVTITVTPVNDAPLLTGLAAIIDEDTTLSLDLSTLASDVDGDALTFTAQGAQNGIVTVNGAQVDYSPNANYNGNDSFVIIANDGNGGVTPAQYQVTITAVDDAPTAVNDAAITNEITPITIDVLLNDFDVDAGDTIDIESVGAAASGTVSIVVDPNTGRNVLAYIPNRGFIGTDSFTYTIIDSTGLRAIATVDVTVDPYTPPQFEETEFERTLRLLDPSTGTVLAKKPDIQLSTHMNIPLDGAKTAKWMAALKGQIKAESKKKATAPRIAQVAQPNEQPARQANYTMDALGNQFVTPNTAQNAQLRYGIQIGEPLLEYAAIDLKTGTLKEAFKTEAMHTVKGAKFIENRKKPGYLVAKVKLDKLAKGTSPRTIKFITEPAVPPADGVTYPAGYQLQSTYTSKFKESIALRPAFTDGSGFFPLSRYTMEYASPLRNDATDVQLDGLAPVPITDPMFAGDPVSVTDVAFRRYDMVNQAEKGDLESTIVRAVAKKIGKLPNGTQPDLSALSKLYVRRTQVSGTPQLPSTPQYIFEVGIKVLPEFIDSTGVARPVIVKGTSFEEVMQYTAKR